MSAQDIRPINIWQSLILVLIPGGTAAFVIHFLIPPFVENTNTPFLYAYLPWWIFFMLVYFIASFVAYKLEGKVFTLSQFAHRYRLHRIRGWEWFWFFALLITFAIALAGLGIWGDELSSLTALSMPAAFPAELDLSNPEGRIPGEFMGVTLKG